MVTSKKANKNKGFSSRSGTRTRTILNESQDFKSCVSAIPPSGQVLFSQCFSGFEKSRVRHPLVLDTTSDTRHAFASFLGSKHTGRNSTQQTTHCRVPSNSSLFEFFIRRSTSLDDSCFAFWRRIVASFHRNYAAVAICRIHYPWKRMLR